MTPRGLRQDVIAACIASTWVVACVRADDLAMPTGPRSKAPPNLLQIPADTDSCHRAQAEWSQHLREPREVTNGPGMKLVLIPPGRFVMGPNGSTSRVTLAKPYYLAATEVTLGQYRKFKPEHAIEGAESEFNSDDRPAAIITWDDARSFCRWLSDRPDEKAAGRVYSLPTETQWEWAARAGTSTTATLAMTTSGSGSTAGSITPTRRIRSSNR